MAETYTIKLPQFEGPFDLLLFFIERDELDIYDIPIAQITDDFLAYIRRMEALNIDLASEFILVAATLMSLKAKMLLPRRQLDEHGQEIDPRQELVERLIEYKRFKEILETLKAMEEVRSKKHPRGHLSEDWERYMNQALVESEMESLSLFKLMRTFDRLMRRFADGQQGQAVHQVLRYPYTIQLQQTYLRSKIKKGKRTAFKALFEDCENRMHAIVTFLALLELLNRQEFQVTQGNGINNFWVA